MSHVLELLFHDFTGTVRDVFMALLPIVCIFLVLQITGLHVKKRTFKKIMTGFVITFVGLTLFMQGVHIAFVPVGEHFGNVIGGLAYNWILIPIGFVIGFLVAFAEPAVHVMIKQVEDISSGTIKSKVMLIAISLGVAFAVAVAMARLLFGIPLLAILLPGYIIVFVLSRFVSPIFIAMAFDNGGVATGPMCSTFILSMSMAVAGALGGNPLVDGLGTVSLIALAPIITTMLLSFLYKRKNAHGKEKALDTKVQSV